MPRRRERVAADAHVEILDRGHSGFKPETALLPNPPLAALTLVVPHPPKQTVVADELMIDGRSTVDRQQ